MKAVRLLRHLMLLSLVAFGLVWIAASIVARPFNRAVAAPVPPVEAVELAASDGTRLAASYWPGRTADAPAVLLLHGINNNRTKFARQAEWLNGLGYAVLALDFRGHGRSAAVPRTFGWREGRDAAAAFAFLKKDAPERKVGVIGVSLGGAAALLGEGGPLPAEAMVLHAVYPDIRKAILNRIEPRAGGWFAALSEPLLSYQSWLRYGVAPDRIAPLEAIRSYRGAVLVIGGMDDRDTRPEDSRALHAAAPGEKALWLLDGADHVETSKVFDEAYRRRVGCLFAARLGVPGGSVGGAAALERRCANSPSSSTASSTPARATPS